MALTLKEMHARIIANLPERTGRDRDAWLAVLASEGPTVRKDRIAWFKDEHGSVTRRPSRSSARPKGRRTKRTRTFWQACSPSAIHPSVRDAFEALREKIIGLGDDVTVEPCKTSVGFKRRRQFAVVRPDMSGTLEVGVALEDDDLPKARSSGGARISALVPTEPMSVLRQAYEADA